MSSQQFSLDGSGSFPVPDATDMRFGIVVTEWNSHITDRLLQGAIQTFSKYGVRESNITVKRVPGSFELTFGCAQLAKYGLVDAIIAIGCVIRGDTPHFDYICQAVSSGLSQLNAEGDVPVIFGLLTTNSQEQAEERSGGLLGNKGEEYAVTAIKMVGFSRKIK